MKYRDLTILPLTENEELVIACDSCAGIGEKENDIIKVPAEIVGQLSTRVPLLEVISYGAKPIAIIQALGNEMQITGKKMIAGMKAELKKAGYFDLEINGSTEENMQPTVTSVGVTVVAKRRKVPKKMICKGDSLYILGIPLVGKDVILKANKMVNYEEVKLLLTKHYVKDIVPIGSKGSLYEANEMSKTHNVNLKIIDEWKNSQYADHSGGPSTAILVAVALEEKDLFEKQMFEKAKYIGYFI